MNQKTIIASADDHKKTHQRQWFVKGNQAYESQLEMMLWLDNLKVDGTPGGQGDGEPVQSS